MKKKIVSLVLTIIMIVSMLPLSIAADMTSITLSDGTVITYYGEMFNIDENGVLISSSAGGTVVIPSGVKEIGEDAFKNHGDVTELVVPASVEKIGNKAFGECAYLTKVTFEENSKLKEIGDYAFWWTGLTSVVIPKSVERIGASAFAGTMWKMHLKTVIFEEGSALKEIGGGAFMYNDQLESIVIPKSVEIIGSSAFRYSPLKECILEKGTKLKKLGDSAFASTQIETFTLPAAVETIGDYLFYQTKSLVSFELEEGSAVTSIGEMAFSETGLESFMVPATVETIGYGAFGWCPNLTTFTFEKGSKLKSIGVSAFAEAKITSITIPATVEMMEDIDDFGGTFIYCEYLEEVIFEEPSVLSCIPPLAFYYTPSLKTIHIPETVTEIGESAFGDTPLSAVYVNWKEADKIVTPGEEAFSGRDGQCILYVPAGTIDLYKAADVWKDFPNIVEFYTEYNLTKAPTMSEAGTYNKRVYKLDESDGTEVDLMEKAWKTDKSVTFEDWYLRTMIQYKAGEGGDLNIRFASMLDEKLDQYMEAGFIVEVNGQKQTLTVTEAVQSFVADGKTYTIGDFSEADDYFFLQNTVFAASLVAGKADVKVTPFVTLMDGKTTLKGASVTFNLGDIRILPD